MSTETFNQVKEKLNRLDAHIRFEFDLTAQRVSYLATSEAFLFTAFAFASANIGNAATTSLSALVTILPWVGLVIALGVLPAVFAAHYVVIALKKERCLLLRSAAETEGLTISEVVEHTSIPHRAGWIPPFVVPISFVGAWLYILLNKCS